MVPDVKGNTMAAAREQLEKINVVAQEIPNTSCDQQPNLPIIGQSVVGQVEQRSVVEIYYCAR